MGLPVKIMFLKMKKVIIGPVRIAIRLTININFLISISMSIPVCSKILTSVIFFKSDRNIKNIIRLNPEQTDKNSIIDIF